MNSVSKLDLQELMPQFCEAVSGPVEPVSPGLRNDNMPGLG